jgi:hypothetical protein
MSLWQILQDAVAITCLVASIMIAIEFINVRTRGLAVRALGESAWRQYMLAVFLGATPGCLGAFSLVALYSHQHISLGALVAGMIATSGDEMFVMMALIPRAALLITGALIVLGLAAGWATDRFFSRDSAPRREECRSFQVHEEDVCHCFTRDGIVGLWTSPSRHRLMLTFVLAIILITFLMGWIGPSDWNWKRYAFLAVAITAQLIVIVVPDHFLEEHFWNHVLKEHMPRLFFWTLGAFAVMAVIEESVNLQELIAYNKWLMLLLAAMIGIIPESGPHLLFVTLFAGGSIPFGVLLANSAVQDGHGMLPLLAYSRRDFVKIKIINIIFGLGLGFALMGSG